MQLIFGSAGAARCDSVYAVVAHPKEDSTIGAYRRAVDGEWFIDAVMCVALSVTRLIVQKMSMSMIGKICGSICVDKE